ncbi:MerR family transcriptional regulator [Micromonospora sp. NPDC050397]|uniref:MerR family transcriptional regulator n=1 Tax=Micromonospora sp. NPDC050397 TaxID=3364279 RepID=UPI00384F3D5A
MDGDGLYSIGDLARRTGLTVKAIRFYADREIVPPTERGPNGYRRYDHDAAVRLDLVRTLRALDIDLPTIRRVVDRTLTLAEVARAHAEALQAQIRLLRLRRAVLVVAARRGSDPEEMDLLHKLATLSENERRRLIGDFLDSVFTIPKDAPGGPAASPDLAGIARSLTPELPDDPGVEQVEAWVELAELSQDPDFRALVRRMVEQHRADAARPASAVPRRDPVAAVRDLVGPVLTAGIDPTSPRAAPVVAAVMTEYAHTCDRSDDADLRRRLLVRLETVADPRWERYLRLLSLVNGWSAPERLRPALDWFVTATRARLAC